MKIRFVGTSLCWLILIISLSNISIIGQNEEDPVTSITTEELRDHIFYLASDELQGRQTGSKGYQLAAVYSATQFRAAGLKPVLEDSEGKKTFYQGVKLLKSGYTPGTVMKIKYGDEEKTHAHGDKYAMIMLSAAHSEGIPATNPVFFGLGIDEPDLGWNDYEGMDVEGKIGIIVLGAPIKDGKPVFPEAKHDLYSDSIKSYSAKLRSAIKHKLSAFLAVLEPKKVNEWYMTAGIVGDHLRLPDKTGMEPSPALPLSAILLHPDAFSEILKDYGYDPDSGNDELQQSVMEDLELQFDMERFADEELYCRNVVAMLEGSDPELKNEYVVVSAHLDHVGVFNNYVMNGADDNASGSSAVLEVAEAAAMDPPARSVIFVLYTGEEKGLLGSQYFVENLPVPKEKIVININTDMIGRNSEGHPQSIFALVSKKMNKKLRDLVVKTGTAMGLSELDMSLNDKEPDGHGSRSDQRHFSNMDIPYILVTRGFMQPHYHLPTDDAETINYNKVTKSSRLIYALIGEVANSKTLFTEE